MPPSIAPGRLKALQSAPRKPKVVEIGARHGASPEVPAGADRLTELLDAQIKRNEFGEHLALRRWFSDSIGDEAAPDCAFDPAALRLLAPDAPDSITDADKWLFLDTETTGLAGGTGTYPFLVGIAWWDAGGLEVEQFFMREQSEEHSLLVALRERIAERPVLVTFNGKSFDWPLLETRYRMTRSIKPPALRAHIDFLHPARNLWRLRLGSVRLAELEKHVLGWNRGADVISELIPQTYFDYLRGGPPEPLVPIFQHNQMDLRGLAALATRVLALLANPETHGRDPLELFGLSRICERRGEATRARRLYAHSIARELPPDADRAARRSLARLAKRDGDHDLALELWGKMAGASREGLEAYEQLAIHYEHRSREPHRAAALVRKALNDLRRASRISAIAPSAHKAWRLRFQQRLARLERKAGRSLLDALESESQALPGESN
ncbi:MAG TPA: ribonuclease H-like domain-containing protein [Candidatus Acidoferrales bacterium]|nr:ribonuclease H-like domain-containing protein [Candidatus Acidoferrales bacterium]